MRFLVFFNLNSRLATIGDRMHKHCYTNPNAGFRAGAKSLVDAVSAAEEEAAGGVVV